MQILNKYIGKSVIFSTLFVVFVLMGFQLFISFFTELGDIGKGGYSFWPMMQYVFLMLPGKIYQFFPMAGLIGSLIGLGHLASNHELVVMRTSGVSVFRILLSVMKAAIMMIVVALLIGEVAAPYLNYQANQLKANAEMQGSALKTKNGVWLHQDNRFIRVEKVISKNDLQGITEYHVSQNNELSEIISAQSARKKNGVWQLNQIVGTTFDNNQRITSSFVANKKKWHVQFKPRLVKLLQADPDNMSLIKIHQLIAYRSRNNLSAADLLLSFWQRIIRPLSILVLIFLGAPIIFGPLRSVSMGVRLMIGISVGFIFFLANRFFGPISIYYQVSPLIGASLPLIIFLFLGLFMVRRVR